MMIHYQGHVWSPDNTGNAELALQSLIQERFNPTDSPDVYESRVRKHIVGFADDQVLPALYTHLPPDLRNSVKIYMIIRGAGFQTVDNFFANLRKCWVERQVGSNIYPQSVTMGSDVQLCFQWHKIWLETSNSNEFISKLCFQTFQECFQRCFQSSKCTSLRMTISW